MNEILNSLASTVNNLLPVIAGGVIGLFSGLAVNWKRTQSERESRHQELVLESATALLANTQQIKNKAESKWWKSCLTQGVEAITPEDGSDPDGRLSTAIGEEHEAWIDLMDELEVAKSHVLRISILAPRIAPLAERVVSVAEHSGASNGSELEERNRVDYAKATNELTEAVGTYIKVKSRK